MVGEGIPYFLLLLGNSRRIVMQNGYSLLSLLAFMILFGSCGRNTKVDAESESSVPAEMVSGETASAGDELIGDWNVDSSVFINDGVRGEASPPIVTTTWTFGENGDYKVVQSIVITGTYKLVDKELIINSMSVENHHEIVEMTADNLVLSSTIIETEESSMKTMVYLTRK